MSGLDIFALVVLLVLVLACIAGWVILALSFGFAHNASKGLTYAIGGSALINGDGQVDQTAQNVRFAGEFDTNVVFLVGGSIQWRF